MFVGEVVFHFTRVVSLEERLFTRNVILYMCNCLGYIVERKYMYLYYKTYICDNI